jgi:hypothetical protein
MSRLTIHTRHLVGMLKDLAHTASTEPLLPAVNSVLLHTDRSEILLEDRRVTDEDALVEVVTTDVLVGTSTDRTIMGQAHAPCTGRLHAVVLISAAHAKKIVGVFEPLLKAAPKTAPHVVELALSGEVLVISEDRTKIPNPVVLSIGVLDQELEGFPRNVASTMEPEPHKEVKVDGEVVAATLGIGLAGRHLEAVAKVAKRRKMTPVVYSYHQLRPTVVTVGSWYQATLLSESHEVDDDALVEPLVPAFQPPFPPKKEQEQTPPLAVVAG